MCRFEYLSVDTPTEVCCSARSWPLGGTAPRLASHFFLWERTYRSLKWWQAAEARTNSTMWRPMGPAL
jgi:hypothetical protein